MKRLSILLFACAFLFMVGCSSEETSTEPVFDFAVEDLESRIGDALNQMGNKTDMEVISNEVNEDGRNVISLSDDVFFFIESDGDSVSEVTLAAMPNTNKDELMISFQLLVGVVDNSLSLGDRSQLIDKLGIRSANLTDYVKVVVENGVEYTYEGTQDGLLLRATVKR